MLSTAAIVWCPVTEKPAFSPHYYAFGDGAQNEQARLRVPEELHVRRRLWLCPGGVRLGAPGPAAGAGGPSSPRVLGLPATSQGFCFLRVAKKLYRPLLPLLTCCATLLGASPSDSINVCSGRAYLIPRWKFAVILCSWAVQWCESCSNEWHPASCLGMHLLRGDLTRLFGERGI